LTLKYDYLLSSFAFNFNLRRYTELFPGQGSHLQQCWPDEPLPGLADSCSGEYPITEIVKETRGVLLASEKATPSSAEFQVAIAGNGECSMTSSSGFAASTVGRCRLTLSKPR